MGLFDLFGSKKQAKTAAISKANTTEDLDKIIADSDRAIAEMQKADAAFKADGDIEKLIGVYEKYLLEKPKWNSFNFNLSLATFYSKAGRNNDAWRYLNQLYAWSCDPSAIGGDVAAVRHEQFRLLKSEKKHKDALVMLVSSYVLNAYSIRDMYFNKEKFKKEAKTTAKAIGFSEDQLGIFADDLEKKIKARKIQEVSVTKYCSDYFSRLGL